MKISSNGSAGKACSTLGIKVGASKKAALAEKISEEELQEKLEELGKKQQNNKKNLQQILELTKRYYVTKKAEKIQKAAEDACYDAMFEVHRVAREYDTSVIIEADGVTVETQPLTDAELKARQAKIRKGP